MPSEAPGARGRAARGAGPSVRPSGPRNGGLRDRGTLARGSRPGSLPLTLGGGLGAGPQPRLQGQVQQEQGGSARGQHVGFSCSPRALGTHGSAGPAWECGRRAAPRSGFQRAAQVRRARRPGCRRGRCSRPGAAELSALAAGQGALWSGWPGWGRAEAGAAYLAGIPFGREVWGRPERGAWAAEREA